ncbi:hypothetical protein D9611_001018 [Ephemerocybe angulata]|uniref:Uncharacterized protein n=1 Tax=Ephemerocybe angulata TaxID=980116 RepID=A0A8H5BM90_9AGAR|nr:hypothetical protein D9611_001018 [Tulosesus angulatus]
MTSVTYASRLLTLVLCFWVATYAWCLPGLDSDQLQRRTYPNFPDKPDSCPICAKDYASIQGCAEAAPVFENFTNVIFNPGAFVDTIRCACADTFKAVFPQCVDCFIETGQEDIIMGHNLPAVVEGIRKSGYRAQFMPHWGINQQPDQRPNAYDSPTCEPIFLTTMYWPPKYKKQADGKMVCVDHGGEYLITWYLGSIPENAVRETGTGMPDEVDYVSHLLTFEEARERVPPAERRVLNWAWRVYCDTLHYEQYLAEEAAKEVSADPNGPQSAAGSAEAEGSGDDQPTELGVAGGAAEVNLER